MRVRRTMMVVGAVLVASGAPAQAQCAAGYTADACTKAVDLFNFLTPQISTALAGGAATIGQGGVLGGFPHFALGLRVSAVQGAIPDNMNTVGFSTTGAKSTTYITKDQFVPMATIDGSLGIFKGFPLGVTRIGGLDLLATLTYIPKLPDGGGDIKMTLPGGSTKLGAGVRIGLLQESLLVPGVAVTYVQRSLPTLTVTGTSSNSGGSGAPGSFALNDLSLKTSGWRLSASKTFLIFGLQAGVGQDKYENSVGLDVTVNAAAPVGTQHATATASNTMTRTNMYAGASLNFFVGKLVAEVGKVSGGTLPAALNKFGTEDAAASRSYFSLGLRTGF